MEKKLEILFNSKPRVKILQFSFERDEAFSSKEMSQGCNLSLNIIKRELNKLSKIGLFKKEKKKGKYFYFLNSKFPFLFELRSMIKKIQPLSFKKALSLFKRIKRIKLLFFSGIFLKEERSPVDILIVGDNILPSEVQKIIKKIEEIIGKEIKWTLFTQEEYKFRLEINDSFLKDFFRSLHKKLIDKLSPKDKIKKL